MVSSIDHKLFQTGGGSTFFEVSWSAQQNECFLGVKYRMFPPSIFISI